MSDERRTSRRTGVESNLRTAVVWSAVSTLTKERQSEIGRPLRVLDLGGGTGGLAVPLATQGHTVTVIDPSLDALASLRRRSAEAGAEDRVRAVQGDAESLADILKRGSVDLVCCHGTLEVVEDADDTLARIAHVLAPGGYLSLVTAQRLAVVLARALAGRFEQAHQALTSTDGRWGEHDPLPRRFDAETITEMVERVGFTVEEVQGLRLFSDLVPSALIDGDADRQALLALEIAASTGPAAEVLGSLGSAIHVLARRD
ncbi:methyltransferase domain-containing protein [Janibacter sp. GXQ6167]|uniref:methyltransferase domain-containing protein n=1 Tax=Janibacter sp. GXQ6167 TaxID=3240791 RepID=UPI00352413ED